MSTVNNPLLDTTRLPTFDTIRAEHVAPAIDQLLGEADAALEKAVGPQVPADYEAVSAVLDVSVERLGRSWGAVSHLNHVADSPDLRAAYTAALPKITEFYTRLSADERLFAKYKAIRANPETEHASPARRKVLADAIRDFVLAGAELQGDARKRYAQIQERHAELAQQFSEHVLDATDGFAYYASEAELEGVPADVKEATAAVAAGEGKSGHKLTLHLPVYLPLMQYAENRALRERLYTAYVTRASELGPAELDNSALMRELLLLEQEEAALLGYPNAAEVSLVPKMARDTQQVTSFLSDLAQRARPYAERDLAELREFAAGQLGMAELQAWDVPFASERLKEARYAFSEQDLKQYFTEPKVLEGLFSIVETVFDVAIRPDTAPTWHPTVRFYRIERKSSGAGDAPAELLGQFYLDAYARPGKRPGAWMDGMRGRWQRPAGAGLQTPVAHLVCNYAAPVGNRPALLSHDDLITLFHEFGHGLHHLLTKVDELAVAGTSGVEWDAVELPSQFMENFCWEWDVLKRLSAHVDTGEPLPRALFDKMIAAKNFQSGLATLRQIELSLFDMRAHAEPGREAALMDLLREVRREVAVLPLPAFNRYPNTFTHIFSGGYAAGYYSYKWAEVLSADAWSAFEEAGVLDSDTGRRYREAILETGGSRSAMDNFVAFRGREPSIDALLRHQGMA